MSSVWEMTILDPAARQSRIGWPACQARRENASASELCLLICFGAATAVLRGFLNLRLGLPGHSIVLVVPPLVLGLASVPRRQAGTVMGLSGLAAGGLIGSLGLRSAAGPGALAGIAFTGVMLDLALRIGRSGWTVHAACIGAGLVSNTGAFLTRLVVKYFSLTPADTLRPLAVWLPRAAWSYPVCGAVAGLISAALLFRLRSREADRRGD